MLLQPAEVDRVEHVAVEDELLRVGIDPRRTASRKWTRYFAWQLSLPRWMSEMTTASNTARSSRARAVRVSVLFDSCPVETVLDVKSREARLPASLFARVQTRISRFLRSLQLLRGDAQTSQIPVKSRVCSTAVSENSDTPRSMRGKNGHTELLPCGKPTYYSSVPPVGNCGEWATLQRSPAGLFFSSRRIDHICQLRLHNSPLFTLRKSDTICVTGRLLASGSRSMTHGNRSRTLPLVPLLAAFRATREVPCIRARPRRIPQRPISRHCDRQTNSAVLSARSRTRRCRSRSTPNSSRATRGSFATRSTTCFAVPTRCPTGCRGA